MQESALELFKTATPYLLHFHQLRRLPHQVSKLVIAFVSSAKFQKQMSIFFLLESMMNRRTVVCIASRTQMALPMK